MNEASSEARKATVSATSTGICCSFRSCDLSPSSSWIRAIGPIGEVLPCSDVAPWISTAASGRPYGRGGRRRGRLDPASQRRLRPRRFALGALAIASALAAQRLRATRRSLAARTASRLPATRLGSIEMAGDDSGNDRPSVAAYFADLDDGATPFLFALGQAVLAAAVLESNLRLDWRAFCMELGLVTRWPAVKRSANRWPNSRP